MMNKMCMAAVIAASLYAGTTFAQPAAVKKIIETGHTLEGPKGTTDFVRIIIKGSDGKLSGGSAPTLGVTGRLGGLGARPEMIGFVSDGDGALTAISAALKLCEMKKKGDVLPGDVIVTTHVCPDAPTSPHFPTPFMGSPVEMETINKLEVEMQVDAVLSADTTKGNKIICKRGFAISCPVKEGYILKASDDLRSDEISVGKECRSRWRPYHSKQKQFW